MLNDFITMLAGGAFAVLVVIAARHFARKWMGAELPKWVMPAAAGAAMLGVTIFQEYQWYPTTEAALNDGVEVVLTRAENSWWRPWTYVAPITTGFMAVNTKEVARAGDIAQGNLLLIQRWQMQARAVPVAFDCANSARADLLEGAEITADGQLNGGDWLPVAPEDPALRAMCGGGANG